MALQVAWRQLDACGIGDAIDEAQHHHGIRAEGTEGGVDRERRARQRQLGGELTEDQVRNTVRSRRRDGTRKERRGGRSNSWRRR